MSRVFYHRFILYGLLIDVKQLLYAPFDRPIARLSSCGQVVDEALKLVRGDSGVSLSRRC